MAKNGITGFSGFFGQSKNKESLRIAIDGAKALGKPLRNMLFAGNPGVGKTTFAMCAAVEMGVKMHELCGSHNMKPYLLTERLKLIQAHEILFIDEIHDMDDAVQDALQRAMTEGVVPGFEKASFGRMNQLDDVKIPPITIIGATDKPGKLHKALLSRFGLPIVMTHYSDKELQNIARAHACKIGIVLTDDAVVKLASTCAGIPREAIQRLEMLQSFAAAKQANSITADLVQECLNLHGISEFGLGETERGYLSLIAKTGTAGAKLMTLQAALSADANYLLRHVEPKLQNLGLINIDDRRRLTLKGLEYIKRNIK